MSDANEQVEAQDLLKMCVLWSRIVVKTMKDVKPAEFEMLDRGAAAGSVRLRVEIDDLLSAQPTVKLLAVLPDQAVVEVAQQRLHSRSSNGQSDNLH